MKDLNTNINELETKVKKLEETLRHIESNILTLSVAKMPNNQYPFWNIILSMNVTDKERTTIEHVLDIFELKKENRKFTVHSTIKTDFTTKVFNKSSITATDCYEVLEHLTNRSKKQIFEILHAMYKQGICKKSIEYIFFDF